MGLGKREVERIGRREFDGALCRRAGLGECEDVGELDGGEIGRSDSEDENATGEAGPPPFSLMRMPAVAS